LLSVCVVRALLRESANERIRLLISGVSDGVSGMVDAWLPLGESGVESREDGAAAAVGAVESGFWL
jgi:hypothetical protein